MPTTVNNDPDSINKYRGQISSKAEELRALIGKTEIAIQKVGESWKDSQFQQFQQNFNQDKEMIKPLCDVLNDYSDNILYQLENKLRVYGDQSMRRY